MSKMKLLIWTIVMIVLASMAVLFFMGTTIIDSLQVVGNEHMSRDEILELVDIYDSSSVLEVMINPINTIEDISYISVLEVEKKDLKNVVITVHEKDIIGYVDYMGKYICLDSSGYIVDYTDSPDAKKPKIKGIDLTTFNINEPMEVSEKIVLSIDTIYRNALSFEVPIEWIDFSYGQGNRITLKIRDIDIKIGDVSRIEEKFSRIKESLNMLPEGQAGILYVENLDDNIIFKKIEE